MTVAKIKYVYAGKRRGKLYAPGDEVPEEFARAHPALVVQVSEDYDPSDDDEGGDDAEGVMADGILGI